MDYNTSRKKLFLPEYGRHVQKMVDFACTIEDREERNKVARAIIAIMGNLNPGLRDQGDVKHKLWDHLAIISDFKLDIDSPYEKPEREKLMAKPRPIPYQSNKIDYMHYGRVTQSLIQAAIEKPDGEEKDRLVQLIANHMKKSYVTWNRNQVSDEFIFQDLVKLSGGKLKVREDLRLAETREILAKPRKKKPGRKPDHRHSQNHKPGNE